MKAVGGASTADAGSPLLHHDDTATATVTLDGPAPAEGATITITRSGEAVIAMPASIAIPAGTNSGTFTISVSSVSHVTEVLANATYKNVTKSVQIRVQP